MQKLLRFAFLLTLFSLVANRSMAQCNPVIFGEDTICAGSSTYLYVNDIYTSYSWSNGSTASYTYATGPGTITLNTIDGAACHGSASITIRQVQPPALSFTTSVNGYSVTLTNTSSNAFSYQWIFGDGSTSSATSPTHLYNTKAIYTICLNSAENFCPAESYCSNVTIGSSLGMPTDSVFLKVYSLELFNLNKVVQNPIDSGYLIAGQYDNCGECSSPMLIKTNKNGQVQWSRNFDYLFDVQNLEYFDNGYVFLSSNSEFSITKIDLNGNIEWQKYDGIFGDKLIFPFSNTRVGLIINQDPMEVIIYDQNGNVVTQKSYDLGGWDMNFHAFAKTSDGSVLLNGEYGYNFPGPGGGNHIQFDSYDQVAAKMDVNGNFLWMNGVYQNTQCSQNGEPLQNSAGEYLFPGKFYEPTASTHFYYISRFDGSGNYIDSYSIDSLKGEYSMFLSPANRVVIASRPEAPEYDSLRIVTMDNSFNILSSKKVTAYNCSRSTKTYDGYIASAFTYFDLNTFLEYPALYKTNMTANTACLDGTIPPISYEAFPYVYAFSVTSGSPAYTDADTSAGCIAHNYDDSSLCRTCNVTVNIQVVGGDTLICNGETVNLQGPANMYEYSWSTGEHTRAITVSTGGTYTLTVYNYQGCSATASKHITSGVNYNIQFAITAPNGLCEGSSYSIHAYDSTFQSVFGISWNTGVSGPFVYPDSSGTFITTFVDQYNCPTIDSITINLLPVPPIPNISGPVDVCTGDSVQLCASFVDNGSGPYTFSWNGGQFTDSCIYVLAGTYSVTVTNQAGCDTGSTSSHTVTPRPVPDPNIQPQDSAFICPGNSTTLTAAAGMSSYLWSNSATTRAITVSSPGVYSVVVSNSFGCTGSESVTVYSGISYNPVFALDTTNGFCEGTSFTLSVTDSLSQPVGSYSWSTGGTNSSINISASNTYSVTLTDAHGCSNSESISVQMHPAAPAITINGSANVCAGSTTVLCASFVPNNSGPYSYSWNSGAYTDSCITVGAGTYQLVLSNAFGCDRTSTQHTVTNHALPVPNIQPSGTVSVCAGTDTSICASSGFTSYLWSNGNTINCINAVAGIYEVVVTDNFGCTGTDSVSVVDRAIPVPNIQPSGTLLVCTGGDTLVCADPGFAAYSWTGGATTNCITATAGNYTVTVTDAFGCTGTDAVTVSERTPPVPNIQPSGIVLVCAGTDTTVCADAGFITYLWTGGSNATCLTAPAGNYTVTVTDAFGCTGTDNVTISDRTPPAPNIQPSGNVQVCIGSDTVLCADAGFASYLWTGGSTTSCITAAAGNYTVTVSDAFGCPGNDSVTVTEYQPAQPVILPDTPPIDTLFSSAASGNQWYEAGVGIIPGATSNYFVPSHDGLYYVVVTDLSGCSSVNSDTANFIFSLVKPGLTAGNISVFPNPAHDVVTVLLSGNFISGHEIIFTLYDVTGRKIFEKSAPALPQVQLSVATLAPAVYLLEITGASEKFVTRIEKW